MQRRESFIRPTFLLLPVVLIACSIANAQTASTASQPEQAVATVTNSSATAPAAKPNMPVYDDYRGVTIGMSADEVRSKLNNIKKGDRQDLLNFSEHESAQIYYDDKGKVTAISIDYIGDNSGAPTPESVLGTSITPKPDGSMYQLNRYNEAGYWVSYNRTAGDKPIVTITMQKM
ncbi:MAG TPA: hypothetical protein VE931_11205 [Pyrinomonadaceae bacterium]|nr:hypothetical protein [Pyrinomonadaceae bacterium]